MKIVFKKSFLNEIEKAGKDLSKLHKEVITNKNGHRTTVWKKNSDQDEKKGRSKKVEEVNKKPKGTESKQYSNNVGDTVTFTIRDDAGERKLTDGKVMSVGDLGAVINRQGVEYKVLAKDIETTVKHDGTIPGKQFKSVILNMFKNDPRATNDENGIKFIYERIGNKGREIQAYVEKKMNNLSHILKKGDTMTRYSKDGEFTEERKALHKNIINEILSKEKIDAFKPKDGEKPKFIMFGGRGGSGKSWFTDKKRAEKDGREVMFDSDKYLVLDADEIKKYLPEYKNWNAGEVHEESSYLMKDIKKRAMDMGINIIIDGTMNYNEKKPDKVKNEMLEAREKGYSIEAHYMFLPLEESCVRSMERFRTEKGDYSGRLVPTDILLQMQNNEKSFESVIDLVDDWSFHDNRYGKPKLVSKKGLE